CRRPDRLSVRRQTGAHELPAIGALQVLAARLGIAGLHLLLLRLVLRLGLVRQTGLHERLPLSALLAAGLRVAVFHPLLRRGQGTGLWSEKQERGHGQSGNLEHSIHTVLLCRTFGSYIAEPPRPPSTLACGSGERAVRRARGAAS